MTDKRDLDLARGLALEQAAQLAKKWRHKAVTSREEAGVIRRTVYVATDAESNCQIRAEVWDGCADDLDRLASLDAAQALAAHDAALLAEHNNRCKCPTCGELADHPSVAEIERRARLDEAKWWYQHAGLGMCYRPCTGKELAGCPYCQRIAALAESQPATAKEDSK